MIRRPLITAALLLAAGAAQAQSTGTSRSTSQTSARPSAATPAAPTQGMTPATPAGPTTPASPSAPATPGAMSDPSAAQPAPADPSAATPPSGAAFSAITPAPGSDLIAVLTQSGQFTTLLKAADATNLTSVLKKPGLTVFAPTDAAFAALPAGALDDLMKPDNLPQLQKLLAYHVVNTKIPSIKGHAQTQIATAAGTKVTLDGVGDKVKVNDATALQPAVSVAGGSTLYPIDKVLSPDFTPAPAAATEATSPAKDDTTAATTTSTTTTKKKTVRKAH